MSKMNVESLRKIVEAHDAYWDRQRPHMKQLKSVYETNYWDRSYDEGQIIIETSRGYEFVEGYIASLFAKNPAVVARPDLRGRGDERKAQELANQFLLSTRGIVEDASRLALIYPCSFIKFSPQGHPDVFKRVKASALPPWEVIVDCGADSWDTQRYIGHTYWVTVSEARQRWGNKQYKGQAKQDYLKKGLRDRESEENDPFQHYIRVVEVYDLVEDRLLVWSDAYSGGEKWLYDGMEVELKGGEKRKISKIPFRSIDDFPVVSIIPIYYSRLPDEPLRGYSALHRVYDQIREINISRTFQANAVRKAARQWLIKKGALDADSMSKMTQGVDGEFIEIEVDPGDTLSGMMTAVPHTPTPPEIQAYIMQVQSDLDRGSIMAPFTRGQAMTGATATEVTALASYSSSEIGRLARERDGAIELMAKTYVDIMRLYLEGDADLVVLDGKAQVLSEKDLAGDFLFFSQDGGSTPVAEQTKKAELVASVGMLAQLGVPAEEIRKEMIRVLDLPESFNPSIEQQEAAAMAAQQEQMVGGAPDQIPPEAGLTGVPLP